MLDIKTTKSLYPLPVKPLIRDIDMVEKKGFMVHGKVEKQEDKVGIPGLIVEAVDKDFKYDDRLGSAITDRDGKFEIKYDERDFKDAYLDKQPDIFLRIKSPDGRTVLRTTKDKIRYKAGKTEEFIIDIPKNSIEKEDEKLEEKKDEKYRKRVKEEAELKKQLIREEVEEWVNKLPAEKRDEPYLVLGADVFTPRQLVDEVKKDTEIGRMVAKTLDKGRLELARRKR